MQTGQSSSHICGLSPLTLACSSLPGDVRRSKSGCILSVHTLLRASLVAVARVRIKIGLDDLFLFVNDVTLLFLVAFSVVVAVVALDVGDGLDLALDEPIPTRSTL